MIDISVETCAFDIRLQSFINYCPSFSFPSLYFSSKIILVQRTNEQLNQAFDPNDVCIGIENG